MQDIPITIEEEAPPGMPEWFVTFADMMSLLLAFFIMLVSMGSFQESSQFNSMAAMLRKQFGHNPSRGEAETKLVVEAEADKVQDSKFDGNTRPGGVIYFDPLAIELTDENKRELHQIVNQIKDSNARIEIRGHAMKVAIDPKSGVRDLWDLVDRRCHTTMRFMVEQGIDPGRIRLANAGAGEPAYNGSDEVRIAENSRVEIRIAHDGLDKL